MLKANKINWQDILEMPIKRPNSSITNKEQEDLNIVEEAGVLVGPQKKVEFLAVSNVASFQELVNTVPPMLAPQSLLPEYFMSNFEKAKLVEGGISKVSFENFKELAGLDYNQLAILLSSARNTLINKRGEEPFSFDISEKLVSLAEVYTHGLAVFENWVKFKAWMYKPNRALGGLVPFDLLHSQFGRNQVHTILGRIEWGVYS